MVALGKWLLWYKSVGIARIEVVDSVINVFDFSET